MKYINKFSTNADYQAFTDGGGYVTPNICYVEEADGIVMKPYIEIIPIFHLEVEEGYTVNFIGDKFDIAYGCIKKASIDILIEYLEKKYGYNEPNVIQVYGNDIKFELYLGDEKLSVNGYIFYNKDVDMFCWDSVYIRNGQYRVFDNDYLNGKKAFAIE
jgi:hypothetical protein